MSPRRHQDLPLLPGPLVGREVEIDEVRRRIAGAGGLLTLTGPPGVGKTSLALTAAHEVAERQSDPALTRREREVAILLGRGLTTNREIAAELVITEATAGSYVQRVMNRLGLCTRAQVAAWAASQRLGATS
jgi:DNA-binding NarL/FixJ family response regulator